MLRLQLVDGTGVVLWNLDNPDTEDLGGPDGVIASLEDAIIRSADLLGLSDDYSNIEAFEVDSVEEVDK